MKADEIGKRFMVGIELLDEHDKAYMLDQIEEARWKTGPFYNRGVHILMDMVQLAVEASYVSPNKR